MKCLPSVYLIRIFRYIDSFTDLLSTSLVCREWKKYTESKKLFQIVALRRRLKGKNIILHDAIIFQMLK